ncbi:S9 family peptidase [Pyrococcus furiosus DSM 3638]|uniref:prolyl oligopeptidase n=3 Tax=Pyrococcus furiosus TaxID=2261 RepID=Q8U2K9_PYRFU|nr:prolyl oligopeptidase family serine peptidase [Pyrococcus furiosus]5T88_A Chain A, Prolyl endopeptidase [Pyrococcus furiosus]5T88_B Chain B, Prolyl endopeptidase [Pyrococcus furiosus]AAL80949.1 prolyl endopeptidase [Pyrococcus furiosus DSM 3638]AFN03613.1 prolyl endopeptidase [Pyrococcus furiosus COM1]QEK78498.1 S9 family peptidase [Pyrococcus furiosus DSM 3638]
MEDPYIWMENLEDERVLKIIEEENKRFREFIGELSDKLFPEVWEQFSQPTIGMARITKKGIIASYSEKDRVVIKWFNGDVIVDSKELEREVGDEVLLQGFTTDEEGEKLAYSFSIGGADEGITRIIDLKTGEVIEEIKPSIWNITFLKDGYYFTRFYRKEKTPDGVNPPAARMFWKDREGERMVFGEGLTSGYFMSIRKSSDGKFAIVTLTYGWNQGEVYIGPIDNPQEWKKVYSASVPVEAIDVVNGKLYILTKEGKGLGKIIAIKNGKIDEVIPEGEFPLEWAVIVRDKILAGRLVHASYKLEVYTLNGEKIKEITFDVPGSLYPLDKDEERVLLRYTSFTIPYRLYEFKDDLRLIEERKVEGEFRVEEDFATSKDGTKVHYFIVKGERDEKRAWVFGYGGFNIALTPMFFPQVIPFLKRGGTFIMANLRGGSEYGEEWHRAGMRENKQNVFDDFIAVLEKLKKEGYKVAAWGRSNGGLLVSATLTQRPDVMDSALIGYPVIDMLRFHKLYIGSVWIPEYGNPEDPKDREFLLKYSPYHNVDPKKKYPPTLIYTGLHDDRVHPAHALKFFMKLKEIGAPVYLRVETKSGHMGASPETRARELTDLLAFVLKTLS